MARILITRLSSFGDVAMLVPVVFSVAARYPQDRFIVLTRKSFAPLFENLGFNINAVTFDPSKRHKGLFGTFKLLISVIKYNYSHVADVHDVLRTKLIRGCMSMLFKKTAHIEKGRSEKKQMIASKELYPPLKPTYERYMEVFDKIGFPSEMVFKNFFEFKERSLYPLRAIVTEKDCTWIGIAPFAKHAEKVYPLDKMENVVKSLNEKSPIKIFLFGSGTQEREILDSWENKYENVICASGKINLINELLLISYLDIMISMDSANMHLASLVETPVVSIWGATHPSLGFYGFKQDIKNAIQTELECRPCSVFGDKPCFRNDLACLNEIPENEVLKRVMNVLHEHGLNEIEQ